MSKYIIDYFVFAENVFPGENGKQSIINIFREVEVSSLPTSHGLINLAIQLDFGDSKPALGTVLKLKLRVKRPDGEVIGDADINDLTISDEERTGITLGIGANGMPIEQYGKYTFEVFIDDEVVASKKLEVIKTDE